MTRDRDALARAQEEVARSLLTDAPTPTGFDSAQLAAARRSLIGKRRRTVERRAPDLAASLATFTELFRAFAAEQPRHTADLCDDCVAFAQFLEARGEATDASRALLLGTRLQQGFPLRITRLPSGAWACAWRLRGRVTMRTRSAARPTPRPS